MTPRNKRHYRLAAMWITIIVTAWMLCYLLGSGQ